MNPEHSPETDQFSSVPAAVDAIARGAVVIVVDAEDRENEGDLVVAAEFCTPGEGHEKGGIEGEAGYFRRNHWVPVPVAADLAALNAQLLAGCQADQQRVLAGRADPVGVLMAREQPHLVPLADEPFDLAEVSFPTVDGQGRVVVRTNYYSVPRRPGTHVEARVYPTRVEVWHGGQPVACHDRCYSRQQQVLDLEH